MQLCCNWGISGLESCISCVTEIKLLHPPGLPHVCVEAGLLSWEHPAEIEGIQWYGAQNRNRICLLLAVLLWLLALVLDPDSFCLDAVLQLLMNVRSSCFCRLSTAFNLVRLVCRQPGSAGAVSNPGWLEVKLELSVTAGAVWDSALALRCCSEGHRPQQRCWCSTGSGTEQKGVLHTQQCWWVVLRSLASTQRHRDVAAS